MDSTILPYIKNQIQQNDIDLGGMIVHVMWILLVVAVVMAVCAVVIGFLRRHHEIIDGTRREIFSDRWAWIPLLCMGTFLFGAMWVIRAFMRM